MYECRLELTWQVSGSCLKRIIVGVKLAGEEHRATLKIQQSVCISFPGRRRGFVAVDVLACFLL